MGERRDVSDDSVMVETFGLDSCELHLDAWRALVRRAIEPNVFMEPDFALSIAANCVARKRPAFLAIWRGEASQPRSEMIGLWALENLDAVIPRRLMRTWSHPHSVQSSLLVDRSAASAAIDASLNWMRFQRCRPGALLINNVIRSGPLFELIVSRCNHRGLVWSTLDTRQRAVLFHGQTIEELLARTFSRKWRKAGERHIRRLSEMGALEYNSASEPTEVANAIELFLLLEQKGWNGRRRTALMSSRHDATFARNMARSLAREGKCRIDWLSLDREPIAMAIILSSGARAYFWKTAYDEALASHSPGVQLTRMLTARQLKEQSTDLTDSCAIAGHPMIERVWPDRQIVVDLAISLHPAREEIFETILQIEQKRRRLRRCAKRFFNDVLRRLRIAR